MPDAEFLWLQLVNLRPIVPVASRLIWISRDESELPPSLFFWGAFVNVL